MKVYPDHPWSIRRNGKECARASTRAEADRIIRQLRKIHRQADFTVQLTANRSPTAVREVERCD